MNNVKKLFSEWSWTLIVIFVIIGLFSPMIGSIALICMLAPVVYSAIKGNRGWCGKYCPRGGFLNKMIKRISLKGKLPKILSSDIFRYSATVVLLVYFSIGIYFAWGDWIEVGKVFVRMILLTTLIAIGLGIKYQSRTWCNSVCPMGTISTIVVKGKRKLQKINHQRVS